ncbi:MAG TPA: DUF1254 domain-containing protein [Steroidobacteraceae bacterium]|nr:DUF1254 domain-containing protein [Steroidobacteraceae bacterium]
MRSNRAFALLPIVVTAFFGGSVSAQNFSTEDLARRMVERRAVEAVIWAMPAVNLEIFFEQRHKVNADWNQVLYWSRLPDWMNQTLTPNPDTTYFFPLYNTQDGPVVIEIPPAGEGSITGTVDDAWQTALEDVGPAGVDKGKGGKYLILPPGYKGTVPAGYIPLQSATFVGFGGLRSNVKSGSDADVARAIAYGKQVKIYPLSQAANPPPTKFVDGVGVELDNIIPYDLSFFEALDSFVQREPWIERDKAMIDPLKSLGIEKGKPFAPDARTKELLIAAVQEAGAWLDAKYDTAFPPYFTGAHWSLPADREVIEGMSTSFADPNAYPIDGRGLTYTFAYASIKHLGAGQFYLITAKDKDGKHLDGDNTYRLHVPPKAPVHLYWSVTVYDRATHAFIREAKWLSRSSLTPGIKKNKDGSVDVWFAPKAPAGKESNWVPTNAGGEFELMFRLYGPEKPLYDKTWTLPDVEAVGTQ